MKDKDTKILEEAYDNVIKNIQLKLTQELAARLTKDGFIVQKIINKKIENFEGGFTIVPHILLKQSSKWPATVSILTANKRGTTYSVNATPFDDEGDGEDLMGGNVDSYKELLGMLYSDSMAINTKKSNNEETDFDQNGRIR